MSIDIDRLRIEGPLLSREQKIEILAKAGIALRKILADDQKKTEGLNLKSYMCPIGALEEYDEIFKILKER